MRTSITAWGFMALVVALAACGDSDILAPPMEEAMPGVPGFADEGLGIGEPTDAETCPERPQDLVFGAYGVRMQTIAMRDPTRRIDVPIDVMVPIDPSGLPLVFGGGPYAVVVFSHGGLPYDPTQYTTDFEPMFPEFTWYWATRGYIVLSPRHRHFPFDPVRNQEWRTRDVSFALDMARELVRQLDPYAFVDLRNPTVAGFSAGATTAAMIVGTILEDGPLTGLDFMDTRFKAGLFLAGYATYYIAPDVRSNVDRLTMPIFSIVGADDVDNEPPNTPHDFLGIAADSPPGGKHGVLVTDAGHWLGARPWRGDAPGTLEVSQQATMLFLRSYARPPNRAAVATLSHSRFCGLVSTGAVEVHRWEPTPPIELDRESAEPGPVGPVRGTRPGGSRP